MSSEQRRAARFFWIVLICATLVSIGGNAVHAMLNAASVPAPLAAAVATVPPLVLLGSTEGVSLLLRARRSGSATYWCALAMTLLLAVAAFVLSFDALRDLAIRAGVREQLSWLWPIAVDATIAQATMALLSLSGAGKQAPAAIPAVAERRAVDCRDAEHHGTGVNVNGQTPLDEQGSESIERQALPAALALIEDGATKQPPEVVDEVLRRYDAGESIARIATAVKRHHSTVTRLVNANHGLATSASPR